MNHPAIELALRRAPLGTAAKFLHGPGDLLLETQGWTLILSPSA